MKTMNFENWTPTMQREWRKIPSWIGFGSRIGIEFDEQKENDEEMMWHDKENEWKKSLPSKWEREKMFGEEGLRLKEEFENEKREKGLAFYRKAYQLNYPKWIRELIAENVGLKMKTKSGSINDEMIARAKEYPIDQLIEIKNGKARCISGTHEDKNPSMNCKNNYAYCHTCNYHADTIKILMDLEGITFLEAVRKLQ